MTPLHPHWQADDSEERIVPVSVDGVSADSSQSSASPRVRTVSRRPAAIAGIVLASAFGYLAFANSGTLPGQVTPDTETVSLRLTEAGADPAILQVAPGTLVEISNDDAIPHVLSFDALKVDGKPLETSPIFPGDTLKMLVPVGTPAGSYGYASKTSPLAGTVVIGTSVTAAVSSSASSQASSIRPAPVPTAAVTATDDVLVPTNNAVLPVNFHTVGTEGTTPVQPLHGGAPRVPVTQHMPITNANSGPAAWIAVLGAFALVLLVTRRAFR